MKVLHVINAVPASAGGPSQVIRGMSAWQARNGLSVDVCTTDLDFPGRPRLSHEAIRKSFAENVNLKIFSAPIGPLHISLPMFSWLRSNVAKFDLVHIHGLYRFPTTAAAYICRNQRIPYIIRPHGSLDPYLFRQSSRSVWLKRVYERVFDLPNLHGASAIHYTTEDERRRAAFLSLRAPTFVVPNGIEWSRFAQLPDRGPFRLQLGVGAAPLVLFLGRLNFKKGLDLLVPAFAQVRARHSQAHLAIVGPDNEGYLSKVRSWVQEARLDRVVHFVDHLKDNAVIQAYVDADIFVLPSYTENFGLTVVEAMACGLPVVISDQVNIHADIAKARAGIVTQCERSAIASALDTFLNDPAAGRTCGAAGRRLVKQRFTWPATVEVLQKEYEAIIKMKPQAVGPKKAVASPLS